MAIGSDTDAGEQQRATTKKPKRRVRRKKKAAATGSATEGGQAEAPAPAAAPAAGDPPASSEAAALEPKAKPRSRRRRMKAPAKTAAGQTSTTDSDTASPPAKKTTATAKKTKKKTSASRRRKKKAAAANATTSEQEQPKAQTAGPAPPPAPPTDLLAVPKPVAVVSAEAPPGDEKTEPVSDKGKTPAEEPNRTDSTKVPDTDRTPVPPKDTVALAPSAPAPADKAPVTRADADEFGVGLIVREPPPPPPPPSVQEPAEPAPQHRRRSRGRRGNKAARGGPSQAPAQQVKRPEPAPAPAKHTAPAAGSGEPRRDVPADKLGPEMIINAASGDECRIAVLEHGRLEELYIERRSAESHVGNIYKGRVTNVEPSIQAVFVDFGQPKNGFLHVSDAHPQYFPGGEGASEDVGRKIPRRDRPPIQKCFRRGQEVIVQVTKEGVGTKGPTLTSYLSIPGRFLVMMPGMSRLGVSRKIEDEGDRRAMREILNQMSLPDGLGFIVRTAGLGRTKRELQRDLNYLSRLWKTISDRIQQSRAPAEVYQESDLVIRTVRDVLTSDFSRVVADDEDTADKAREFLKIALPRTQDIVEEYKGPEPIFHKYGIEEEIDRINARDVPLPMGGSIVIESTEAMVAIDVNSGKFRDIDDAEESAYQINLQATDEIARQLRLRDLGGLIVCDFIDMRAERHKREVERRLRNALKKHKERARILRMSQFGLIEMTRQRQRSSIKQSIYTACPHCRGGGMVKSTESMALEVMRVLQLAAHQRGARRITVTVAPDVAHLVQNQKRARVHELELRTSTVITVRGSAAHAADQVTCDCEDERGRPLKPPA